jgi:hypothetical protein
MNPQENPIRSSEVVQRAPESITSSGKVESVPEKAPGGEVHSGGASGDPAATQPVLAQLPTVPAAAVPVQQPAAVANDTPIVAADDEVIEQEWVQKAKNIVSQTKGDPYNQEKQVGQLQAEYIKKRYGKDIKLTSD